MTKKTVWLSYDLGLKGDYEGLYAWLDNHEARECGNSVAVFTYESSTDFPDDLVKDLEANAKTDSRSRIYVVYRDDSTNKNVGRFILGGRKSAPWSGFGATAADSVDSEV